MPTDVARALASRQCVLC